MHKTWTVADTAVYCLEPVCRTEAFIFSAAGRVLFAGCLALVESLYSRIALGQRELSHSRLCLLMVG